GSHSPASTAEKKFVGNRLARGCGKTARGNGGRSSNPRSIGFGGGLALAPKPAGKFFTGTAPSERSSRGGRFNALSNNCRGRRFAVSIGCAPGRRGNVARARPQ